jgi:DNA-binding transcriptional ArsR family regulator
VGASGADRVFRAISDPTRRAILDLLAERERAVHELIPRFRMSQPGLSQHLRILRAAGLVRVRRAGRQRVYSVDARPLAVVSGWLRRHERIGKAAEFPYSPPSAG